MSDKTKGLIQLFFVFVFIAGSFAISGMLNALKPEVGKSVNTLRTIFVQTKNVSQTPFRIEFDTTGTIETRGTVNIVPEVTGRVIEVNDQLFEGGYFEAGDILFQIEPRDFELDVQRLESEVARARTTLDLEKAEANAALAEWEQFNPTRKAPDLVARKPQMAEANASLKAARAQLEDAKLNLARTSFSLPFAGRVLSSNLEQGQYLMSGQSYGQVFGIETLEIRSSLEGQKLQWLLNVPDPEIRITVTHLGKTKSYNGYLRRSASSLNAQTRFATISFGFKDQNADLLPGTFAKVKIRGPKLENVLVFPARSLQEGGIIWKVSEEGTLKKFIPEVIYADDKHVVSKPMLGISNEGVMIVTNKLAGATEGTKVEINNESR